MATLQTLLEGVALPASKSDLIRYGQAQDRASGALRLLERLPDREYSTLDEVGEQLAPVQPQPEQKDVERPRDESGRPPGGDDYVNPNPSPGAVRHDAPPENPPQKALAEQTKTQSEQETKQEEMLGEENA